MDQKDTQDLTAEQKMAMAAIALLTPALGGMMGGREGALAGAAAGFQGAGSAMGTVAKDAKERRDKLEAADIAAKKRQKERAEDIEDFEKKEKIKNGLNPKATTTKTRAVTTTGPDGKPVTKIIEDKVGAEVPGYVKPEKGPKDITVQERNTLQSQYDKDLGVRKNRAVMESYDDAKALIQDPSPASDQALIFAYMKALDPSSVVRETEAESAQALGGLMERAKAKYSQMAGQSGLTPAQRQDMVAQIKKLARAAADRQKGVDSQFSTLAGRRNVPIEDLRFINLPAFEDEDSAPTPEEAAAELERRRQAREQASKGGQ